MHRRTHRSDAVLVGLSLLATACATPTTRPVLDVHPGAVLVERTVEDPARFAGETGGTDAAPLGEGDARLDPAYAAVERIARRLAAERAAREDLVARLMGDDGPQQLDPEVGPVDFGLNLMVNLGAGEAPYDDAMPPIHGVVPGRAGFSDSVLQVSWRERVGDTYGLHGTAALTRFQDVAIVDGITDAQFAFFVLGVHASF